LAARNIWQCATLAKAKLENREAQIACLDRLVAHLEEADHD
jgi:hypothetical protein